MFQAEPGTTPGTVKPRQQWYSPTVNGANISAMYGQSPSNPDTTWKAYGVHTGVDYGVKSNSPAYAISNGKVVKAGFDKGIGNYVTLQVAPGKSVTYEHLNSVGVKAGQNVHGGSKLGLTGNTGNLSQGDHLHTEYMKNGNLVSPKNFYGKSSPQWVAQAKKAPEVLGKGFSYATGEVNNSTTRPPTGDSQKSGQPSSLQGSRAQSFSAGFSPTVISSPVA